MMKKMSRFWIAAALLTVIISLGYVLLSCGSLELELHIHDTSLESLVCEIEDENVTHLERIGNRVGDVAYVRLAAGEKGRTPVTLRFTDKAGKETVESFEVQVRALCFMTEAKTGNFSGSKGNLLIFTVFVLFSAACAAASFLKSIRTHLFSYQTIYLGSASLFLAVSAFNITSWTLGLFLAPTVTNMWAFYEGVLRSGRFFMRAAFIPICIFCAAFCAGGIVMVRKNGFGLSKVLGIILSLLLAVDGLMRIFVDRSDFIAARSIVFQACANAYSAIVCYLVCMLFSVLICNLIAARRKPDADTEYLLILGTRVMRDGTPSRQFIGRLDRAAEFALSSSQLLLVPTGGQGADEPMAEGDAGAIYLRSRGLPSDRILIENRSTTTEENFLFAKDVIGTQWQKAKTAFCTTNFHVFRAGIFAEQLGWPMPGLGSRCAVYAWPSAFVREFLGLCASGLVRHYLKEHVTILVSTAVSIAFMTFEVLL